MRLTAAIVTYNNDQRILKEAIDSFLDTELVIKLFIIDNSPEDSIRVLLTDSRIEYIFNNANLGFGKAHNIGIKLSQACSAEYHLVLNPDVYFSKGTLEKIYFFLNAHPEYGLLMPKVIYPNGETQYLCKNPPSLSTLILRRFMPNGIRKLFKKKLDKFEYRDHNYDSIIENVPYLSGCFMFFRNETLKKVGGFDERIFMYMEDADITYRTLSYAKTVYYPEATITHHFAKGSYKNFKLMYYNIEGAFIYFKKWGLKF
ncbi:glycosyltransferase family 2 protein [Siphonobacter sp. SORGH_AS_1065]|uniref:glycosyltransferase family 2 protein n=1 Tax=Siphonobacter sp. SORGH_AS_1065 TaxID=3041795 RepID=UPI00277D901E|nr:glycosyltransferase family 2 protein [Siphonobacter sp. SORGH_AS_1065]MDQ1087555.1 GT2 family glycosyltransferase [Siphonobacter sp. SORGH_AS_1065]